MDHYDQDWSEILWSCEPRLSAHSHTRAMKVRLREREREGGRERERLGICLIGLTHGCMAGV